jgi:hypothetical protein
VEDDQRRRIGPLQVVQGERHRSPRADVVHQGEDFLEGPELGLGLGGEPAVGAAPRGLTEDVPADHPPARVGRRAPEIEAVGDDAERPAALQLLGRG